jgi:phosphoenolpyruvate carboxykinase (GTP)
MAMATIQENTMFTNVAETSDGGVWWEGLPLPGEGITIKDWHGKPWTPDCGRTAAHPNSRFAAPAGQCPVIDPAWEDPKGIPIDAIIFGGRRPEGVPLVYESYSWNHGVFVGATMRSETTSAAQDAAQKVVRSDPFAMKPFFGYNFGHYLRHWLSFGKKPNLKLPKIYHVNWFRKDTATGKFLWPGFGENSRAIDWICRRLCGEDCAVPTPCGYVPKPDVINVTGLKGPIDMAQLLSVPKDFWVAEYESYKKFFEEQIPEDMPDEMKKELDDMKKRLDEAK